MSRKPFVSTIFTLILLCFCAGSMRAQSQVVINIPAFTLYLYEQGIPTKEYPISIGTELNPSVLGETTIINKVINPTYYPPNGETPIPPGPDNPVGTRWLGLGFPGYGIHGTNRPESIGQAASAGCIRMANSHVEELTRLVEVGTSVKLVYQTILIQEDPLLHTKTITVYPDVYKQEVSFAQLEEEMERIEHGGVFWPALLSLLKTPTGKPNPLAWSLPLRMNEQATDLVAVEWKGSYYLPFDRPFDPRLPFINDLVSWGEEYYLPLQTYLEVTGLRYGKAQGELILYSPLAYFGEQTLGKAMVYQGELYLNTDEQARQLIPSSLQVVQLWGELYWPAQDLFSQDVLDALTLKWPDDAMAPTH